MTAANSITKLHCYCMALLLIVWPYTLLADMSKATAAYIKGDYEAARYEAMVSAAKGNIEAELLMGQLYEYGLGVQQNTELALYWYRSAADAGLPRAKFRLGKMYFDGDKVAKDYNKAYFWLKQAQAEEFREAKQLLDVLVKNSQGNYVNMNESTDSLVTAAKHGDLRAQYLYGRKLLKGDGLRKNVDAAVEWLDRSARSGYVKSQKLLGELYYAGIGVEVDLIEAYAWSTAYVGERKPKYIYREGRQTARRAFEQMSEEQRKFAVLQSEKYHNLYVRPHYPKARDVGTDGFRVRLAYPKVVNKKSTAKRSDNTVAAIPLSVEKSQITEELRSAQFDRVNAVFQNNIDQLGLLQSNAMAVSGALQGRMELEIVVGPSGRPHQVSLLSTEIENPAFEQQVIDFVRTLNFGAHDAEPIAVTYPLEFLAQ